jgi:hypothetical protein
MRDMYHRDRISRMCVLNHKDGMERENREEGGGRAFPGSRRILISPHGVEHRDNVPGGNIGHDIVDLLEDEPAAGARILTCSLT